MSPHPASRAEHRVKRARSLRVGLAALLVVGAGAIWAIVATVSGRVDYGTAGFGAAVVLTGTLLGLATWDLVVALLARRYAPWLALPEEITLHLPPWIVPYLSPAMFVLGIFIGHQYWH